ncbi:major facilitator superfamily domain-containing protein [Thamnocephalis sphaerospora]|uniref:Major facilitator superfamily domain-containing protein n=1 Tax=Thamnocephalis sphaerospora TaxID=78915 RepID=A0A4P9XLX8_9FUNG|nr:major facilitator superfamily domain-containing protein [Thamnocephalis sphaerospora]|eukprot:RKP06836.1 major facilitator superfamily domain-containing protein [Thamnocephalis sphaerospora]
MADGSESVTITPSALPVDTFSSGKKNWILFQAAVAGFVGPFSSTIYLPAILDIVRDLETTTTMVNLTISLFILFLGAAPLVWAPLSERIGRRPVYIASFVVYTASSIGGALSRSIELLVVMRVLQACGSSAAGAVGAGSITDVYRKEVRGSKMGIFMLGVLIGPVLGPIIGGALNQYTGWPTIFWLLTAVGGVILLVFVFSMPETLLPEMRQKKGRFNPLQPLLLFRYPAVLLSVLYPSIAFGSMYLLITVLPIAYTNQYHFTTSQIGLTFIAGGLGNVLGSLVSGYYADYMLVRAKAQDQNVTAETRLKALWPSVILLPLGFLIYGWFLQRNYFWFLPLIGSFIMSIGLMVGNMVVNVYLIDAFTTRSASAIGAATFLRNVFAAITPLFAVQMVEALDNGWTFTVIALVCLASVVLPALVYVFGRRWRPAI